LVLTLSDGRQILDASGGAAVACIGHGNKRVAAAIARQVETIDYVHTSFFSNQATEDLASILVGHEPGGLSHAFFVSSGSEAMEAALKLARQYHIERGQPQRVHFISRRQSYHGNTLGSLGVSGNVARRGIYEPILPTNCSRVSPCFAYHDKMDGESDATYVARLAAELIAEFERVGPDKVIAFVAEPVVGATAGCVTAVPGYFQAVRDICDRYGALLILDEVMSGMGRTGTMHAWEQEGICPDLQTIAKGFSGGYQPIAALLVSRKVVGALGSGSGAFVHGHTYQAHPVACAAALEVQRIIHEEQLVQRAAKLGRYLEDCLRASFADHPFVGDIRGRGLFWALEFVRDRATKAPFDPGFKLNWLVKDAGLERGVCVYPTGGTIDGISGDHIIIAPPYNASEEQIEAIVGRLRQAVDDVLISRASKLGSAISQRAATAARG
jgi:adenosylmethionine-8-amino-7-oxononanoate aminotransferase